jgi:hypothetical protein
MGASVSRRLYISLSSVFNVIGLDQAQLIEDFVQILASSNVHLPKLISIHWIIDNLFVGPPCYTSEWAAFLPESLFTLGGLTALVARVPTINRLHRITINLRGVMTEGAAALDSFGSDVRREMSALQLYLVRPGFQKIFVNADILFSSWQLPDNMEIAGLAELWACERGFSNIEAKIVEDMLRSQCKKFNSSEFWTVRCLCTSETALQEVDNPTDILDRPGLWFDPSDI